MHNNVILLFVAILGLSVVSCSGGKEENKGRKGWTLVWEDDFNDSELNSDSWSKIPASEKGYEKYMSDDNSLCVFQNGKLVLRGFLQGSADDGVFLTGGIATNGKKLLKNGRIEVRAKLNAAPGTVSFISLVPVNGAGNIRIDAMQRFGTDEFVYQSVTSEYTATAGKADNPPSSFLIGVKPIEYHIYSVEFYPDSVVFFVDEMRTKSYPRILTDVQGQFPFYDQDFSLMLGVGIQNPLTVVAAKPVDLFVDWVRFYEPEKDDK